MGSIFPEPVQSFDRSVVKWEDYLYDLTPVTAAGGLFFKREDYFAPLGYGSVNGSKMRQCTWLVSEAKAMGQKGYVSGSVTGSPQHPFIASNCKHYGMGCLIVIGTKNPMDHNYLVMAKNWGAHFYNCKVGYAKTLGAKALALQKHLYRHEVLETNITVTDKINGRESIREFHDVGAAQAENIPFHTTTLIVPSGSCNSITSILYGIWKFRERLPNLEKILMMGIGNNGTNNPNYVPRRLAKIDPAINDLFSYSWNPGPGRIAVEHHDINGTGFCKYSDLMPFQIDDIDFHPRYEGKVWNFMRFHGEKYAPFMNEKTLFWIVGSQVSEKTPKMPGEAKRSILTDFP